MIKCAKGERCSTQNCLVSLQRLHLNFVLFWDRKFTSTWQKFGLFALTMRVFYVYYVVYMVTVVHAIFLENGAFPFC